MHVHVHANACSLENDISLDMTHDFNFVFQLSDPLLLQLQRSFPEVFMVLFEKNGSF